MWPFGSKNKDKKKSSKALPAKQGSKEVDISHLSPNKQALMRQMRSIRAEIGEEELQKMAAALRLEDLKNKVRSDIESDPSKRERLIDEIRFNLHDDKRS